MPARRASAAAKRKYSEDEVLQRWSSLSLEQRKAVMRFDDVVLVGRIRSALQALFEKHSVMQQLCANLGCEESGTTDPFEASVLLKHAFEFTWGIARMADNPSVVMMNAAAHPIMVMKVGFLQEAQRLIGNMKNVLPDFLAAQTSRMPMPKARWKDLWGVEPSSMIALEQQLAKLTEQALWAMVCDQSLAAQSIEEDAAVVDLSLEPWMAEHDQEVVRAREASKASKKKKKRAAQKSASRTEPSAEDDDAAELGFGDDIEAEPQEALDLSGFDLEGGDIVVHGSYTSLPPCPTKSEDIATPLSSIGEDSTRFTEESGDPELPAMEPCELRPPCTPPSSPCASRLWQPPQLVNYIWGHTSQLSSPRRHGEAPQIAPSTSCSGSAVASTRTPESRDSGVPRHRGQWIMTNQAPANGGKERAFVRNTFIDFDPGDGSRIKSSRSSRSLSPSFSLHTPKAAACTDQWQWYWH